VSPIKNIILDWSGTLVDDFPPVWEATNNIFREFGKPTLTMAEFKEKFFLPFQDFYKIYLPEVTLAELDVIYHDSFKLLQDNIPVLPHAREFLEYGRSRQMPMFLLSTIHARHFEVQGERLGLKDYFKQAYTQAYDKRKTILQLLEEHGLNADETLFIGDMMHDIEAARHGGVRSCGVLTGYDSLEKLKRAAPDLIFRDLSQVRRYLERHQQEEFQPPPIATVGGLLANARGQVLMVQTYKWSDLWGIPGGKIKRGETSEEALRREIREETGLELGSIRFVLTQDCIESKEFYKPAHFLLLNFTAQALSEEVILNDEADHWKWVYPEEALQMPINQPTRILLEQVVGAWQRKPEIATDKILIEGLKLQVHIGVPDKERRKAQKILATIEMEVESLATAAANDEIEQTVDYFTVAQEVKALAARRPRKLLETLAEEIAAAILRHDRVKGVTVRLEKFILPNTRCVTVQIRRQKITSSTALKTKARKAGPSKRDPRKGNEKRKAR
jgi:dihydroneopterin aldolase